MKKIALIVLSIITVNASSLSGLYNNNNGASIEVTEQKNRGSGDIQFIIKKDQCNFEMVEFKSNIHKNKLVSTDDQGYGLMRMATFKFSKNTMVVDFSHKLVDDYGCSNDLQSLNGYYTKR